MKLLLFLLSLITVIIVANFKEAIPYYDKVFGAALIVGLICFPFSKWSSNKTCYSCNEKVSTFAKKCKHCHSEL
tara:strand:- start:24633 stop:24854 length:222 start_codon:yes stop_codon:yes gene_type:complete